MDKRFDIVVMLLISLIIVGASFVAHAAGSISVEKIAPIYVERGEQNCLVTIKAHVTNHEESDDITIDVVGVDAEGYQLQTVKLTGHIDGGATKVLLERVKMSTQTYDQIVGWELMK